MPTVVKRTMTNKKTGHSTVVVFARAIGRNDESVDVTTLADAASMVCDMRTLVLIGSQSTRKIEAADGRAWVYTPRSARGE